ncbi:MAG: hypothetical protein RL146_873 [Actinomycetota bacterium]|jgi:hypothetical protein
MNSTIKLALLTASTLLAVSVNPSISARAEKLDLVDESKNAWMSISATADLAGKVNFEWNSADPTASVQISGDLETDLRGQSQGELTQKIVTNKAKLEYRVVALRESPKSATDTLDSNSRYEAFLTNLQIDNPGYVESIFGVSPASASAAAAKTYLRYQTFIPKDFVDAPGGVCTPDTSKKYKFKGDNRGFDPASGAVKSRFQVTVDWNEAGSSSASKFVGATHRYLLNSAGLPGSSPEKTETASSSGMVFTQFKSTATLAHFQLEHSVTNPMCDEFFTFPIWYYAKVWIARSGAYTIDLELRRAPNHELYIKDSDQADWKTIIQESTYSMDCFNKFWVTQFACSGPAWNPTTGTR